MVDDRAIDYNVVRKVAETACAIANIGRAHSGAIFIGVADKKKDVEALIKFCRFAPSKVNLIEYNPIGEDGFAQADSTAIEMYQNMLEEAGITVTVRKSRGKDIDAACGQLANKKVKS